jgi:hypothetical protein
MIPENVLLKDLPKQKENRAIDRQSQRIIQQQRNTHIKKAVLEFARSPIKHYPIITEEEYEARKNDPSLQQGGIAFSSSLSQQGGNQSQQQRPMNQQYSWRTHNFPPTDDNSAYLYPHPPVIFVENEIEKMKMQKAQEQLLQQQKEKEYDSVANSGKRFHILSQTGSVASTNTRPPLFSQTQGDGKAGGLSSSSSYASYTSSSVEEVWKHPSQQQQPLQPQPFASQCSSSNNSLLSSSQRFQQGSQQQQQQHYYNENESLNAIRSNYMAENSIRTEPQLPVKLVRLRNLRNLKNVHLKNNLYFLSLEEKEKLEKKKRDDKMLGLL